MPLCADEFRSVLLAIGAVIKDKRDWRRRCLPLSSGGQMDNLRRELVRRRTRHGSTFLGVGASGKPDASLKLALICTGEFELEQLCPPPYEAGAQSRHGLNVRGRRQQTP
jgi:hypothetical protein